MAPFPFFLLQCFFYILPAYFANMAPVIMKDTFKSWAVPIDRMFGKEVFGSHKTWRGLIFGVFFASVITYLQSVLSRYPPFKSLLFFDYSAWLLFSILMGLGALLGDMGESAIKRRLKLVPGARFVPWDQLDFVIGAMLLSSVVFVPSAAAIITVAIMTFVLDIAVNHIAFYLKIRSEKW